MDPAKIRLIAGLLRRSPSASYWLDEQIAAAQLGAGDGGGFGVFTDDAVRHHMLPRPCSNFQP